MKINKTEHYSLHAITWPRKPLARLLASCLLSIALPTAYAANWAWDTVPASPNFSSADWTSGAIPGAGAGTPASGDSLYFGVSSQLALNNDFTGYTFAGLNFNSGANSFTLGGNTITNTGNIINSSTSLQTINLNLVLKGNQTVTTTAGGGDITLSGNISGAYGLTNNGGGTLTLSGANTYGGYTVVNGGVLNYSGSLNAVTANITANARLNISGALSISNIWIGNTTGGFGAVYQTGGSVVLNEAFAVDNFRVGSGRAATVITIFPGAHSG